MIDLTCMTDNHEEENVNVYFDTCAYRSILSDIDEPHEGFIKELITREKQKGYEVWPSAIALWELTGHLADQGWERANCENACRFACEHVSMEKRFSFEQAELAKYADGNKNEERIAMYESWAVGLMNLLIKIKNNQNLPLTVLADIAQEVKCFKCRGNMAIKLFLYDSKSFEEFQENVNMHFARNVLYDCLQNPPSLEVAKECHPITFIFLNNFLKKVYGYKNFCSEKIEELLGSKKRSNSFVDAVFLSRLHTQYEPVPFCFVTKDKDILRVKEYLYESNHRIISLEEYLKGLGFKVRK